MGRIRAIIIKIVAGEISVATIERFMPDTNFLASLENFNFLSSSPVFVFVNPSVEEVKKIITKIE